MTHPILCFVSASVYIHTSFGIFLLDQSFPMDSEQTKKFQPPVVPRDAEGYVQSFDINNDEQSEIEKARAFFDQYGFVVFSNVYTPEQCAATIDDIWNVIESMVRRPVRNDENLWTNQFV